jgi:adenylate cyclase
VVRDTPHVYVPILRQPPAGDARGASIAEIAAALGIERSARAQPDARLSILAPLALEPDAWRTGVINFLEDDDGVGRRYYLWLDAYGWRIPSLPVRIARDLGWALPEQDAILLDWHGDPTGYRHIAYADVFEDLARSRPQRPQDEFRDRIVLIGSTASGLHDLRVTPLSHLHPGVEILATAIDNLKNGAAMRESSRASTALFGLLLIAGVWFAFQRRLSAMTIALALALLTLGLLASIYWLVGDGLRASWIAPLLVAWVFYFAAALLAYRREKASRDRAVSMFGRFLNPGVVRELVEQGQTPESMAGQAREITVLFSDIRGFTTLSESRPAEEIVGLLNRYFHRQVGVVFRHGGTLDKFIGDAVMAFWGAPVADPRHAERAVAAALEMTQVLDAFKAELTREGIEYAASFDVGIGLHSGRAVVGFIGSAQKLDYTAIGDTVNLASRMEGLTKGVARILVSRETRDACNGAFDFVARGTYRVKGRAQDTEVFEPVPPAVAAVAQRT